MPKLILRCNYLKNAPSSHLANYINYVATREGVEKVGSSTGLLPATSKQKELIEDILSKIKDAERMHEYYDYLQKPNRENASEFITQALENNLDIIAKKKNYIDYLANRPRVEKIGTHGLFSDEGEIVQLTKVADEVANHSGVIWTNVISLRREDANRLGYNSASQWQSLLRSRVQLLAESYKIDSRNLKWYAAFHNESHHPHVHLVVYSTNPSEGYLTERGIDQMRSTYAHDIFRQDFMSIYEKKTEQRDLTKKQAENSLLFLLQKMQEGIIHNEIICEKMQLLSKRLMNTGGKKVYGYLKADVKAIVNGIVDELEKEETVKECYRKWQELQHEIVAHYKDAPVEAIPLSQCKEFKSIKNMIIREAVRYGEGAFFIEESETSMTKDTEVEEIISEQIENIELEQFGEIDCYAKWNNAYKEARGYLYGTDGAEPDEEAAYELMKEEAERGNAYALHDMGKIYQKGIFVEKDSEMAFMWYEKARIAFENIEQKIPDAYLEYRIGKMYQYGLGTDKDQNVAAEWFRKSAGKKNKFAQYALGMAYLRGIGVEKDIQNAIWFLEQSHNRGNPYAAYELGRVYGNNTDDLYDAEKSEQYYQRAFNGFLRMESDTGDDNLLYRIGTMYLYGLGTEVNENEAEQYFYQAVKYGNINAKYQLAKLFLRQEQKKVEGQQTDNLNNSKIVQAVKWLNECAAEENYHAAYFLGKMYAQGILIPKDMQKAISFFILAAEKGNQYAQYSLGKLYLIGKEVEQNKEKAYFYFSKAADQGNIYAAYFLEHWNELKQPDLMLMATRLLHHLEQVIEDDITGKNGKAGSKVDRKLLRKIKAKKISQGHARDDHEAMVQTQ